MIRPQVDYLVDRSGVEVQQCMQQTDTNRSKTWPQVTELFSWTDYTSGHEERLEKQNLKKENGKDSDVRSENDSFEAFPSLPCLAIQTSFLMRFWGCNHPQPFPVIITERSHLFPYRTQQLSSLVPTIPGWQRSGKIGLRRNFIFLNSSVGRACGC